ncbi:MAG: hypothetical protein A2X08_12005 [Bacteroidetes bacterium GWA2_32_17]|nr:MAG: hypothetical protein A2X08_12005 [Bacteroidetes bacterium GWA2_32_17]
MKTKKLSSIRLIELAVIFIFLAFVGFSCGQSSESMKTEQDKQDNEMPALSNSEKSAGAIDEQSQDMAKQEIADTITNQDVISSSAAIVSKDSSRKFIRTADLKFRVKDARRATLKIEDIIGNHNGFVTYTELKSEPLYTEVIQQSEDSSIEIIHYRVVNDMTLRVPNTELDSTIRAIGVLAEFLDYRIIKAEDVSLSILSKQLAAKRLKKYNQRITNAIDNKGNRLNDISQAEDNKLNRQEQSDNNLIDELSIKDRIDYSTIQINLYQRASTIKTIIESEKETEPYTTGFGKRFMNGVNTGWKILEFIVLAIINTWSILLIIAATLFTIRYFIKRKKK